MKTNKSNKGKEVKIMVCNWKCPVCKYMFACNKAVNCPRCGQEQTLGAGYVVKTLENNNYYKLYE